MNTIQRVIQVHENGYRRRMQWPELFDLTTWEHAETFQLLLKYCNHSDSILEIGCLTGHHLLLLARDGYTDLTGIDFCAEAIAWARAHDDTRKINFVCGTYPSEFPDQLRTYDFVVLFDIVEHLHNVKEVFEAIAVNMHADSRLLITVPKGEHFCDEGHVNFYPSIRALSNLLNYYFYIETIHEIDDGKRIFAVCTVAQEDDGK